VAEFINKNHKADAIVDCTHLRTDVDFEKLTEEEQEKMLFLSSEARFIFYKTLAQKVSMPEIRIVCAISMDGCHGYSQKNRLLQTRSTALCPVFTKDLEKSGQVHGQDCGFRARQG